MSCYLLLIMEEYITHLNSQTDTMERLWVNGICLWSRNSTVQLRCSWSGLFTFSTCLSKPSY